MDFDGFGGFAKSFFSEVDFPQLREDRFRRSDGIFECSGYLGLTTQSGESIGTG